MKIEKWAILTIIVGITITITVPILLTQIPSSYNFSRDSEIIGNTIGGLTAPFVSLIGSIIIYCALLIQIKANKLIREQMEMNMMIKELDSISYDLDNFLYRYNPKPIGSIKRGDPLTAVKGVEAINLFSQSSNFKNFPDSHEQSSLDKDITLATLYSMLSYFLVIGYRIDKLKLEDEAKKSLLIRYHHLYASRLSTPLGNKLNINKSKEKVCDHCQYQHDSIPGTIHDRLLKIDAFIQRTQPSVHIFQ